MCIREASKTLSTRGALLLRGGCFVLVLALVGACGVDRGDFIAGADYEPCKSNLPVCQQTAGCALGENKYIEGDFPGYRNFVVTTPADTVIVVKIFFETRQHPGEDTEIIWYEPSCYDFYRYRSEGEDIFAIAGGDRVFEREQMVRNAGDHLVEVYSDAYAHYLIRVELKTPM
ncbi:MAG: hypothetical protein D6806_12790 [Deltaproteobacteria bacterium]|nr:MAG: hypothetical protein D6806_12790 [Deltaproteobacteria bacterium]